MSTFPSFPTNQDPIAFADALKATAGNNLLFVVESLTSNDVDLDSDTLTLVGFTQPRAGSLTLNGNQFVYTPNVSGGTDEFSYTLIDGDGGVSVGKVAIAIAPQFVNVSPVAANDKITVSQNTRSEFDPSEFLFDDSDGNGDTLSILELTSGRNGFVTFQDGKVVYQPDVNFSGQDSFTYRVGDGKNGFDEGTVDVTVVNDGTPAPIVNQSPQGVDDSFSVEAGRVLTFTAADLLSNDLDPDGDALSVGIISNLSGGTIGRSGNNFTFTPTGTTFSDASFTYQILDGQGGQGSANVAIDITAPNVAPTAENDDFVVEEDVVLEIDVATLLSNDTDENTAGLRVVEVNSPSNGTVRLEGNTVFFTPNPEFSGSASFDYTIEDAGGLRDQAHVRIAVQSVNDAPAAEDDADAVEDQVYRVSVSSLLQNDSDEEDGTVIFNGVASPSNGSVALVSGGTQIEFTPEANVWGLGSFQYSVRDRNGATDTAIVFFAIKPVNDAPEAQNDAVSALEDQTQTFTPSELLGNDLDVDNDVLSIVAVSGIENADV